MGIAAMITALLVLLFAGTPAQAPAAPPDPPSAPRQGVNDYIVGAQDVLKVTVFGVSELTRDVTVDTDGTFDFPLIGRIKAAGLTVRAIETEIKARLSNGLIVNPTVTVDVGAYRSQTVYVLGEVRDPGKKMLAGNASIMTALAEAGFTTNAGSYVIVSHRPTGAATPDGPVLPTDNTAGQVRINRKDLEMGRATNVRLQDGDTIFVPKAETFFISGFVRSPGSYAIDGDLNVLQALALAGGATDQAAQNRITIDRLVSGTLTHVKVKALTDPVKAGDTIIVPRRFF
jgi:polysaccharide export outer membrane protein